MKAFSMFLLPCLLSFYIWCFYLECVGEILNCDHSKENYWAVLSCGAVYYAVQGGSSLRVKSWRVTIQMKATEHFFPLQLFIMLYKVVFALTLWLKF